MREIPELKLTPERQKAYSGKIEGQEYYIPYQSLMLQDGIDLAKRLGLFSSRKGVRIQVEFREAGWVQCKGERTEVYPGCAGALTRTPQVGR